MSIEDIKLAIEPTVEAFIQLGFPKYESQILAILTAVGTSTAKDIHKYTDVPLPKVYQTIESLTEKNLIKQHSKIRPVQFTAYSPDIIMRRVEEQNRGMEKKLRMGLDQLTEITAPTFIGEISPFSGLSALKRIVKGVLGNVKNELSVGVSAKTLAFFKEELSELHDRGVQLRSFTFEPLSLVAPSMHTKCYKELGFNHFLVDLPITMKPNLHFITMLKKIVSIIDFLGIIISDNGESVVLLPFFPHETYFGIWIHSKQIIDRQLLALNELFKIAKKT